MFSRRGVRFITVAIITVVVLAGNSDAVMAGQPTTQGVERFEATGSMNVARLYFAVARLRDGRVLAIGGHNGAVPVADVEIYDPQSETFSVTSSLSCPRMAPSATVLTGGSVLVCGGYDGARVRSDCEVFNPSSGTFSQGPSMKTPRYLFSATELADGRILMAGGYSSDRLATGASEFYDPGSCEFVSLPSMQFARGENTAARLHDGRVLVAGGFGYGPATGEVFDPATNTFTLVANQMVRGRISIVSVVLPNGKVLLASGYDGGAHTTTADLYDPDTNRFAQTASVLDWRTSHAATLLPDGRALVAGGEYGNYTTDYYDHVTETFTRGPNMLVSHYRTKAVLLEDGRVVIAGGHIDGAGTVTKAADVYVSRSSHIVASGPVRTGRASKVTVYLYDSSGTPVPDVSVSLSASGSGNSFVQRTGVTDLKGRFTTAFSSSVAEIKTITAETGALTVSTLLLVDPPVSGHCFGCADLPASIASDGPTAFCAGAAVTLTAGPGASWLWSSGQTTQSIVATAAGTYAVTITQSDGCEATSEPLAVTVYERPSTPSITASGATKFCTGGSVVLTASPAGPTYHWSTGEVGNSIIVKASGVYRVTGTNADGCNSDSSAPMTVTVNPQPATPTIVSTLQYGRTILTASPAVAYAWSTGQTTQTISVTSPGSYWVTVANEFGCSATSAAVDILIAGGHVTGGGWIDSAPGSFTFDPGNAGKANFGFVSLYLKNSTVPTGNVEFNLGAFRFQSTAYEWLVVSGARAQCRGVGKVNGKGDYGYSVTVVDGQIAGGGGVDMFRIGIWDRATGDIIYDNRRGTSDDLRLADPQPLGGGDVVIHAN